MNSPYDPQIDDLEDVKKFFKKPTNIILCIHNKKETTCKKIARETDTSEPYVSTLLSNLEDSEIVKRRRTKRRKKVALTQEGKQFAKSIKNSIEVYRE